MKNIVNIFSLTREYDESDYVERDDFIFKAIDNWDEFRKVSLETYKYGVCGAFGRAYYSSEMDWKIHFHAGYGVPEYFDNLTKADVYMYSFRNYTQEKERKIVDFVKRMNPDGRCILFHEGYDKVPTRDEFNTIRIKVCGRSVYWHNDESNNGKGVVRWDEWRMGQNEFDTYTFLWENMPRTRNEYDNTDWFIPKE